MSSLSLTSLESQPATDAGITALTVHIPFASDAPDRHLAAYQALKAARGIAANENYTEECAALALEAYLDPALTEQRHLWRERVLALTKSVVDKNAASLKHVENILPSEGVLELVDFTQALEGLEALESLSVQWPLRGTLPTTILLNADLSSSTALAPITESYNEFQRGLTGLLAKHAATLRSLRLSLPHKASAALTFSPSLIPTLPNLHILDLTHSSPPIPALTTLLSSPAVPALRHLILDHGAEIPLSDFDDEDEFEEDIQEQKSWAALGTCIAARQTPLRSLCAALHDARASSWPVGVRMTPDSLRSALAADVGNLVLCTAWPGLQPDSEQEGKADLYSHAEGCGHLAYGNEWKPVTGLWSASSEQGRAMGVLKGSVWY
ncbi:hypothetical protein MIND_01235200 [Mycena indigotica]|uniref:Uncharacterized protein n=1 Tax=Mycena indigotica TaxID=2126181 RepID=A0A8H6S4B4_9AGAR|nr:uncharacterized protein MIND_01235200 [Mycena indigotica]KAF7292088.1 hypothetical protein MIND_01235200 [Mycena indigotica]